MKDVEILMGFFIQYSSILGNSVCMCVVMFVWLHKVCL